MRLHRFIGSFDLTGPEIQIRDPNVVHQIGAVLRLTPGEEIVLSSGTSAEVRAEIVQITPKSIICRVRERSSNHAESALRLTVYLAVLKKENFELAVQKLTELGASRVVPILTDRTVKLGLKQERLLKIAREASEQSGRGVVPEIAEPVLLPAAIAGAKGRNLFLHLAGEPLHAKPNEPEANLWIGPEGGWTEEEVEAARQAGFELISLGPRTLRAETAAIAGAALILLC